MESVENIERFPEEVASSTSVGRVSGRPNPTRIAIGLIVREPQNVRRARVIRADQRRVVVRRAEGVLDDRSGEASVARSSRT